MPRDVTGRVLVKTRFALGSKTGVIYTIGRHARNQPELFLEDIPYEKKDDVVEDLEAFCTHDVKFGDTRLNGRVMYGFGRVSDEEAVKMKKTSMQACHKRAKLLKVTPVPILRNMEPEDEARAAAFLLAQARRLAEAPCVAGCEHCECTTGGMRFLYRQLDGVSVNTGTVATRDGMFKQHADGTSHLMDMHEFKYDMTLYDNASVSLLGLGVDGFAKRGDPIMETATKLAGTAISQMVRFNDKEGEAADEMDLTILPEEVRTGDFVWMYETDPRNVPDEDDDPWAEIGFAWTTPDDPNDPRRLNMLKVLAVHSGDRGLVVQDRGLPWAHRIEKETVVCSLRFDHWPDGQKVGPSSVRFEIEE